MRPNGFQMQTSYNDYERILPPLKCQVNMTISEEVDFIWKTTDIIQEFIIIVDLLRKVEVHGYSLFYIGLSMTELTQVIFEFVSKEPLICSLLLVGILR